MKLILNSQSTLCLLVFLALGTHLIAQMPLHYTYQSSGTNALTPLYLEDIYGYSWEQLQPAKIEVDGMDVMAYEFSQWEVRSGLMELALAHADGLFNLESTAQKLQPQHASNEAWLELCSYYFNKKNYSNSLKYGQRIDPEMLNAQDRNELQFHMGYAYFVRKKFDQAQPRFAQASQVKSAYYYPANYYLGMCYYYNDQFDKADSYFELVERSKRYRDLIPYYRIQMKFQAKEYDDVIDYGEDALKNEDLANRPEVQLFIGKAYYEIKSYDLALPYLKAYEDAGKQMSDQDAFQYGFSLFESGQYKEAIPKLMAVSHADNQLGQKANYYLGHALLKEGNKEEARNAFSNVTRKGFNEKLNEEALYNYGLLSAQLYHDREAINALSSIPNSSPYYQQAQDALADVFMQTKDYAQAYNLLQGMSNRSTTLNRAYQHICLQMGIVSYQKRDYDQAAAYAKQAIQIPEDPKTRAAAYFLKGKTEMQQMRFDAAINSFTQYKNTGIELQDPGWTTQLAEYNLGYAYMKMNNYQAAAQQFEKFISSTYGNSSNQAQDLVADALIRLADCEFKMQELADAHAHYLDAEKLKTNKTSYAMYQRGVILDLQLRPLDAIIIHERLVDVYPNSMYADDALLSMSTSYLKLGQYTEAAKPLQRIQQEYPKSDLKVQSLLQLGLIAFNKGDNTAAIQAYKSVLQNNPEQAQKREALLALEEIYIKDLGQPDEYIEIIEQSKGGNLDEFVKDSITYKTAYTQYAHGNYPNAQKAFDKYLTKYPQGFFALDAHYYRGETFGLAKDYSNAYRDYKYVADLGQSKHYSKALQKAGIIAYHELQEFEQAFYFYDALYKSSVPLEQKQEAAYYAMQAAHRIPNLDRVTSYAIYLSNQNNLPIEYQEAASFYLGKIEQSKGNSSMALQQFQNLQNGSSAYAAEARYLMGQIYFNNSQLVQAEEQTRNAIKQNTYSPTWVAKSLILLSDILVAQGDSFNAKAALEAVIENFKEDPNIVLEAEDKLVAIEANEQAIKSSQDDNLLQFEN